ncbi:MAG: sulfurtransferase TusA family protein [Negativicutes bacterium]|nr:sulfurtransferase TusA family protein [Negativicutes bacterium]
MEKTLDLRGLSCPIPLLETQKALNAAAEVTVTVDEPVARENILKFAKSQGYKAECSERGGEYTIMICK